MIDAKLLDAKLLDALTLYKRTAVASDYGLMTRLIQIQWAMLGRDMPLVVSPRVLHKYILEDVERQLKPKTYPAIRLVTPQSLHNASPELSKRVVIEMNSNGVSLWNLVDRCVAEDVGISVRLLLPDRLSAAIRLRAMGFTLLSYSLNPIPNLGTVVRVTT